MKRGVSERAPVLLAKDKGVWGLRVSEWDLYLLSFSVRGIQYHHKHHISRDIIPDGD